MEWLALLLTVAVLAAVAFFVLGVAVQVLWALLIGGIVGVIASAIVNIFQPSGGPRGCLETSLAGIGGSLVAAMLFERHGLIASIVGAVLVVLIWKLLTAGRYAY